MCGIVIEKDQGCNHIICICGRSVCYVCGQSWTKYHEKHDENGQVIISEEDKAKDAEKEKKKREAEEKEKEAQNGCSAVLVAFFKTLVRILLFPFKLVIILVLGIVLMLFLVLALVLGMVLCVFLVICKDWLKIYI
jgi:uncharacterized membrane protein